MVERTCTCSGWHVLGSCTDLQEEMSAIKKLFADHGHIVWFSPKCHPELAGRGGRVGGLTLVGM